MNTQDFTTTLVVDRTPKQVFEAVNNVRGWWTEDIEGLTNEAGDLFTVRFGTTWKTFAILEMIPDKKIVWQVIDCWLPWNENKTEWKDTVVVWEISATKGSTQLRFTHLGLLPEHACFDACSNAWAGYLNQSLRRLIENGEGEPHRNTQKAMV